MRKSFGMAMLATIAGLGLATSAFADDTATSFGSSGLKVSNGNYSMAIATQMQQRLTIVDNHGGTGTNGDAAQFHIRRLKTSFGGHILNKKWSYDFTYSWTGNEVEDGNLGYELKDNLTISMGRQKITFNLEEKNSSKRQTFVDRSLVNETFNLDFGTGLWIDGSSKVGEGALMYHFGIFNGKPDAKGQANKGDFANGSGLTQNVETTFMFNTQLGFAPLSDGKNITKYMSDLRGDDKKGALDLYFGVGANYAMYDATEAVSFGNDGTIGTIVFDGRMHLSGISVSAAYFYRSISESDPDAGTHASGLALTTGYNINLESGDQLEFAARYSAVNDDDFGGRLKFDGEESGFALNYRFSKEKLKATLDANYTEKTDHAPVGTNVSNQWQFRFQVQLMF